MRATSSIPFVSVSLMLAIIAVACSGSSTGTIRGTMTLTDDDPTWSHDARCSGDGGYSDIREGAQVTVRDGAGEIIAVSSLSEGRGRDLTVSLWELGVELAELEDRPPPPSPNPSALLGIIQCEFQFEVDVPEAAFYAIEVSHRGELTYSHDELAEQDWTVGFTLGN